METSRYPLFGAILKKAIEMRANMPLANFFHETNAKKAQDRELRKLLLKASETHFADAYGFKQILKSSDIRQAFKNSVPTFDYNKMFSQWWYRTLQGESFVAWPGKIKHFALSSGTSDASSKYIPVTQDMIKAIRKTSTRQLFSLAKYDFPNELYEKGALMLGGSTHLQYNGTYFAGDLSGITTGNLPFWFEHFYKPGKRISKERDWSTKLEEIIKKAPEWDIAAIVGVPAWLQILMEKIIDRYQLDNIHDIWPNLSIYVHGGVSFEPYKQSFEKLLGKPLTYMETYLASEGFLAFQNRPGVNAMELVLNNGLFFEFVPFNEENFDEDCNMVEHPQTLFIDEVEENKDYAILISTCSGAWRYLIGDTVRFTSLERNEIVITGRTKSFLSICGEHLSVDNFNHAIKHLGQVKNVGIPEYTVLGVEYAGMFAHQWYVAADGALDGEEAAKILDEQLKVLNDDYRVERLEAIRKVSVTVLPPDVFYDYMRIQGKEGAQNKFPRVLKGDKAKHWLSYLENLDK